MKRWSVAAVLVVAISLLFYVINVVGKEPVVEQGKTVTLDYVLVVDDLAIDSSDNRGPIEFVYGDGKVVKGLEKELAGMKVNETKEVTVSPEEGFGPVNPQGFKEVSKTNFPEGYQFRPGVTLQLQDSTGRDFIATISEVRDETVVLNLNHPLAGKELHYTVTVTGIK